MFLAKVVGKVVSTQKNEKLIGTKLLIVKEIDHKKDTIENKTFVAVDTVGAGIGDITLIVCGSSASSVYQDRKIPSDASIVGIVDSIEIEENY